MKKMQILSRSTPRIKRRKMKAEETEIEKRGEEERRRGEEKRKREEEKRRREEMAHVWLARPPMHSSNNRRRVGIPPHWLRELVRFLRVFLK
jgi:hypothetical protein